MGVETWPIWLALGQRPSTCGCGLLLPRRLVLLPVQRPWLMPAMRVYGAGVGAGVGASVAAADFSAAGRGGQTS